MSNNIRAPSLQLMTLPLEVIQMIFVHLFNDTVLQLDLAYGVGCGLRCVYTHSTRPILVTCRQIRQDWTHYFLIHTQLRILLTQSKDGDYCSSLGGILRSIPDTIMTNLRSVNINPTPEAAEENCTNAGLHLRCVRYACLSRCRNVQQIRVRESLGLAGLKYLGMNILQAASSPDHLSQAIGGAWTRKSWPSCCLSHAAKHTSCQLTKVSDTTQDDSQPIYTLVSHLHTIQGPTAMSKEVVVMIIDPERLRTYSGLHGCLPDA